MKFNTRKSLIALAVLALMPTSHIGVTNVSAAMKLAAVPMPQTENLVVEVGKSSRSYRGGRHHNRRHFRHYGGRYNSHRGYHVVRPGNSHVSWCYSRYRSYNARNNTWISNSGRVRQCISPYY